VKPRLIRILQKYVFNPPVRALFALGVAPPFYALVETTGRVSGRPRRTPVGNGLVDDTFWIVTELGHRADYVRNIETDGHVRVRVRHGLRLRWRNGTARVLEDDDARSRQQSIAAGKPGRLFTGMMVRTMSVEMLTVRIDLDPLTGTVRTRH
jgi:deazaflavin-dependent oxidoreductase (nitroreductase family)